IEVRDTEIKGLYTITPEGFVDFGDRGTVRVGGLTVELAQRAIRSYLTRTILSPTVNVELAQMRRMQNIKGEHLVRPDGTISLGMYGSVFVKGQTLGEVKRAIEQHLGQYLIDPKVTVD